MCWSKYGDLQLKARGRGGSSPRGRRGEAGREDALQERQGSARARPKLSAGDVLARSGGWRPAEMTPPARVRWSLSRAVHAQPQPFAAADDDVGRAARRADPRRPRVRTPKSRNLKRDTRLALSSATRAPYSYESDEAKRDIDRLAENYIGQNVSPSASRASGGPAT